MGWGERIIQLLYLGDLSVWIGSVVGVALVAAPAPFSRLPRPQAGEVASEVMLRLNVLRLAVVAVIAPVALLRLALWDREDLTSLIVVRYVLLFIMMQVAIAAVLLAMVMRQRVLGATHGASASPHALGEADRQRFRAGHAVSQVLGLIEVLLGLTVLLLD